MYNINAEVKITMNYYHTHMDKYGRILIPSKLRDSLGYKTGSNFVMRTAEDELHVISLNKAVQTAQKLFKQYNNSKTSVVDEFLKQKYLDASKDKYIITL